MKNKKNYSIVAIVLLAMGLNAQVLWGVRAGINGTNITDVHTNSKSRVGFHIGGQAMIPVIQSAPDQFYFQPELIFAQQGEYNEFEDENGNSLRDLYDFNYILLPINFKAYFSEGENEFFALAGPQFGFLLDDKIDAETANPEVYEYKNFDVAIGLGLGFSYQRNWEIEGRYVFGLTDMVTGQGTGAVNHTSRLSVSLSYVFY